MQTHEQTSSPDGIKLRGNLGAGAIIFMVVAQAAPLTVMAANTPLLISMGNGAAAPLDAAIAGLIMLFFAVGFTAMTPHIGNAGAFYAYVQKGLGKVIGLGVGTLALISYFCILIALEAYFGFAASEFLRSYVGISIPWQLLAIAIVVIVCTLGYRHVELSAKFLGIALVLEISVVLLINLAIIFTHAGNGIDLTPVAPATMLSGSPGLGILFAIFSFMGFEATAVYREEARNPDVTIPRATYGSVILIGIFYVVSMWCEVVGVGTDKVTAFATEHPGDMYQLLAQQYVGSSVGEIMQVLLLTSLFACILSIHNVIVRYKYIFGRYGILPAALSQVHSRHGSPHISSLTQSVMSLVSIVIMGILSLDPVTQIYTWGATSGTVGYMAILALTCLSVIVYFSRFSSSEGIWSVKIAPFLGLIGVLGCLMVAIINLPSLVGGDNANLVAEIMIAVNILAFALGAVAAAVMKSRSPARFNGLNELA
ncbi:MAG: APC family permease [Rhizobium sp.]|nr:MAG: APC family permease [Rhizobium sp.]